MGATETLTSRRPGPGVVGDPPTRWVTQNGECCSRLSKRRSSCHSGRRRCIAGHSPQTCRRHPREHRPQHNRAPSEAEFDRGCRRKSDPRCRSVTVDDPALWGSATGPPLVRMGSCRSGPVNSNWVIHGDLLGRFVLRLDCNDKQGEVNDSKQDDPQRNRQEDEQVTEVGRDHGGYRLVGRAPECRAVWGYGDTSPATIWVIPANHTPHRVAKGGSQTGVSDAGTWTDGLFARPTGSPNPDGENVRRSS